MGLPELKAPVIRCAFGRQPRRARISAVGNRLSVGRTDRSDARRSQVVTASDYDTAGWRSGSDNWACPRPSPRQASMKSSICRATVRISKSCSTRSRPARTSSARRSGASSNWPSAAARLSASPGSTVIAHGPQISAKPPRPEVMSAAPLASASSAVRPNGSGPVVSTIPTAALSHAALTSA